MNINTLAAPTALQNYPEAPTAAPQTGAAQQGAAHGASALSQPDPKPDFYGTTVTSGANYYPDKKTMKSQYLEDENGNSVRYEFDRNGKRTHESDKQVRDGGILVRDREFDYDGNGHRTQTNPNHVLYSMRTPGTEAS